MDQLKNSSLKKAIRVTSGFEGSGYGNIAGNFDGQYMSFGFLQWCFGQGTLQPLFRRLFNEYPGVAEQYLPDAESLLNALNDGTENEWALQIQSNNRIDEPWASALINLGRSEAMQTIQDDAASFYINKAVSWCEEYEIYTERAFCLFFDIAVQCGSMVGVPSNIKEMDYMTMLGTFADCASTSPRFKQVVMDRKMAIVNLGGIVYGEQFTFDYVTDDSAFGNENQEEVILVMNKKMIIDGVGDGTLNVRACPASDADVLGELVDGDEVAVLGRVYNKPWLMISLGGDTIGYISTDYAKDPTADMNDIDVLAASGIFKDPEYWRVTKDSEENYKKEYVDIMISRFAQMYREL